MAIILAIDDDKDIRYTLTKIGEVAGWKMLTAANGEEGIAMAQAHKPHIVLIDYHMPGLNGLETMVRLRELMPDGILIMLTVDDRNELAQELLARGASDFALKPIKAPDLIARINVHLRISAHENAVNKMQTLDMPTKGYTPETMQLILDYLAEVSGYVSIRHVADKVALAYQTAHRYLNFLKEEGMVDVTYKYGHQGRPSIKYRLKR